MRPPLIYPQLPHLYNHGLAISPHAIWKEFLKAVFLLKYHQNPWVLKELEHRKKEKILEKSREKKKEKEMLQDSSNKKGKLIFWENKNIATSKSFCMSPFSSPPSNHFKNPFKNHLRKFHSSFWTIL
jgi:hypothetical protein